MNEQLPRPVTFTLVLTGLFWLFMLCQQAAFVLHTIQAPPDHPVVAHFARRYLFTSSAQVSLFFVAAFIFCTLIWRTRQAWAAGVLVFISGLAVWRFFLAGSGILFRPPLGDGTLSGAIAAQLRLASQNWIMFSIQTPLLFALVILWIICCHRLSIGKPTRNDSNEPVV